MAYQPSPDQLQAMDALNKWYHYVLQTGDYTSFFTLQGGAGTGKTTTVAEWWKNKTGKPETMIALAASAITARNAQNKTDARRSYTTASFLKAPMLRLACTNLDGQMAYFDDFHEVYLMFKMIHEDNTILPNHRKEMDDIWTKIQKTSTHVKSKGYQLTLDDLDVEYINKKAPFFKARIFSEFTFRQHEAKPTPELKQIKIAFFDEIGMVNERDLTELKKRAMREKIAFVLAGDIDQIPPVDGKLNTHIQKQPGDLHMHRLTTSHRQSPTSYLYQYSNDLTKGYTLLDAYARILEDAKQKGIQISDVHQASRPTLEKNGTLARTLSKADVIVTFMNKDVKDLTRILREYIYPQHKQIDINFHQSVYVGERIVITANEQLPKDANPFKRLVNGMEGTVIRIHDIKDITRKVKHAGSYSQVRDWKDKLKMIRKTGLLNVDVLFDEFPGKPVNIWLNVLLFDNPRMSSTELYNTSMYRMYPNEYDDFKEDVLSNPSHPLYNEDHQSIMYASYGYVLSAHKAQGREWDNVIYYEDTKRRNSGEFVTTMRKIRYSGVTRAKKNILLLHRGY